MLLTERIAAALNSLRIARDRDDMSAEFALTQIIDRLLDRYTSGER